MVCYNFNRLGILFSIVLFLFISFKSCDGAKILVHFLQGSYSMVHFYNHFGVKLAERGHQVTLLIGYKYNNPHPNITYIIPDQVEKDMEGLTGFSGKESVQERERNFYKIQITADGFDSGWPSLPGGGIQTCKVLLKDPKIQEWVNSPSIKFDLVVVDSLWNDCGIGLAYKFKAPHILFETFPIHPWLFDTFGLPPDNSVLPDVRRYGLTHGQLSFLQRVRNALDTLEMYFRYRQIGYMDRMDEIIRNGLNMPEMPYLGDLERTVSLILSNSHYTSELARALPPLVVQVGGLQCEESDVIKQAALPQELAKFLGKYDTFVYISFGTIFHLNWAKQQVFLEAFRQFPEVGFVFRWTGDMPKNQFVPQNTFLSRWVPQTQLLAHKKIRAFISHAGLMSTQESVFYGVPVISIPGFADQDYNAECLKRLGVAVKLELVGITVEQLVGGIKEILFNSSYLEKMKKVSSLSRDRPEHPMDTAIWWTEYVIRNTANGNGLDHLKPLGMHQFWFERRMLDVWLFLAAIAIAVSVISFVLVRKMAHIIYGLLQQKKKEMKKKPKRN